MSNNDSLKSSNKTDGSRSWIFTIENLASNCWLVLCIYNECRLVVSPRDEFLEPGCHKADANF